MEIGAVGRCFTEKEKLLLISLVSEEKDIIENKRTDGTTLSNKYAAWNNITQKYNSQADIESRRTAAQLKKLWNNLKQKKKQENFIQKSKIIIRFLGELSVLNISTYSIFFVRFLAIVFFVVFSFLLPKRDNIVKIKYRNNKIDIIKIVILQKFIKNVRL